MPRLWCWFVTKLVLAAAVHGATILDKRLEVEILPTGGTVERTRVEIRIDGASDLNRWSTYAIYVDDHRTLAAVEAYARGPGGEIVKVRRKDQDVIDATSRGVFVDSARFHVLSFTSLSVGWVLVVDYRVEVEPYFPAERLDLAASDPIERLRVEVSGGGTAWRWRIDGPDPGFEIAESPGGVTVTASGLPAVDPPTLAPGGAAVWPVLRYAWGEGNGWDDVGRWLRQLLEALPRDSPAVTARARELIAGVDDPRQRLAALLAFMQRQVRYVAVEVGIGGFQPSAPEAVLERRWGDCKDKAILLIDLLEEAGIEAHPALILSGDDRRIDTKFPSPWQFNHLIVAVPAAGVAAAGDDPVGDGYLFVDPTQTRGSVRWLHPAVQDQDALVVRAGDAGLARTPLRPELESRQLSVRLEAGTGGVLAGRAALRLIGQRAAPWLRHIAGAASERIAEDARSVFADLLPGAAVESLGWQAGDGEVPAVDLVADLTLAGLVQGSGDRRSLRLPGMETTPSSRLLADRDVAVVLRPGSSESRWQLPLPEGCRVEPDQQRFENPIGVFEQEIAGGPEATLVVRRRAELRGRWFEPESFVELRELAQAEHRAYRRRIRLDCASP